MYITYFVPKYVAIHLFLSACVIVFNVIAEKTVCITKEEQLIEWKRYGLKLNIPPNSLPEELTQCQLKMAVALSGKFELPEEGVLLSAIYLFSCPDLGDRELSVPVTLVMQHCATRDVLDKLCIVRADETTIAPSKFQIVEECHCDFNADYGIIRLKHFCGLGVYIKYSVLSFLRYTYKLCVRQFYTNVKQYSFRLHVYIVPRFEALLEVRLLMFYFVCMKKKISSCCLTCRRLRITL